MGHRLENKIMRHGVEEFLDIQVNDPVASPTTFSACSHCVQSRPFWTITIGVRVKHRFHQWLQIHLGHRLHDSIRDSGDGDFILPLLQSRVGIFLLVVLCCGTVECHRAGWHRVCDQVRVPGLVRRAAGLRWPELLMRRWHWAWMWLVQWMHSRLPAPRRAASVPVLIQ